MEALGLVSAGAAPDSSRRRAAARWRWLAIGVVAVLLGSTLVVRGLWPPDEMRYADVAREMRAGGNFVVPHLDGRPYHEKGPTFFWLVSGLTAVGLPLDVAPRLVSVVAALLALWLVAPVGKALGLSENAVARATWVLATMPFFLVNGQAGLLDALLLALVSIAIAAKLARTGRSKPARLALVALEGLALGAALLDKGPVALLFPAGLRLGAAFGGPSSARARADRSDVAAAAIALGVAFGWLALAAERAGVAYAMDISLGQVVRRLRGARQAKHLHFHGYLVLTTLVGCLPWTVFALARLLPRLRRAGPWLRRRAALVGWFGLPFALLASLRSQQPHYVLPALPAAALLISEGLSEASVRWVTRGLAAVGAAAGLVLIGVAASPRPLLLPGRLAPAVAQSLTGSGSARLAVVLAGAGMVALCLVPAKRAAAWARAAGAATALFAAVIAVAAVADPVITPRRLLRSPAVAAAARLATPRSLEPTVRVLTGRTRLQLTGTRHLAVALQHEPGLVALVWEVDLGRLRARVPGLEALGRGRVKGHWLVAVRAASPARDSLPGGGRPSGPAHAHGSAVPSGVSVR